MDLVILVLSIAVIGFLVWIVTQIPMPAIFKPIIYVVVAIALLYFVAHRFAGTLPNVLH